MLCFVCVCSSGVVVSTVVCVMIFVGVATRHWRALS